MQGLAAEMPQPIGDLAKDPALARIAQPVANSSSAFKRLVHDDATVDDEEGPKGSGPYLIPTARLVCQRKHHDVDDRRLPGTGGETQDRGPTSAIHHLPGKSRLPGKGVVPVHRSEEIIEIIGVHALLR